MSKEEEGTGPVKERKDGRITIGNIKVEPGSPKALLLNYGLVWKMVQEREAKKFAWVEGNSSSKTSETENKLDTG
jgi:hypothetical protein